MTAPLGRRAAALLGEVDRHGLLLQHDRVLPSATAFLAGEPVAGSWWSHPLAHPIYDALQELADGHVLQAKLVAGKLTLVARRLWPALVAVGGERAHWQVAGLPAAATDLLDAVESAAGPVLVDASTRQAANLLVPRLLVVATEVHLPSGRHTKALAPWRSLGVTPLPDPAAARAAFDAAVAAWSPPRRVLPWPP